MADRPSESAPTRPPAGSAREDTVAIPRPTTSEDSPERVLPPMPDQAPSGQSAANGTSNGTASPASNGTVATNGQARTARTSSRTARKAAPTAPPAPPTARPTQPPPTVAAPGAAAAPAPTVVPPAPELDPAARTASDVPVVVPVVAPARPPRPSRQERRAAKDAAREANRPRPSRKARLRMSRIDPWSVMKTAFLLSIALGIVTVVSVWMVWTVLGAADVWSSINKTVQDVVGGQDASTFNVEDYIGTRRVVGFTMIVAAVDVVLVTAIATLGAFLYNMSASLLGGIEVTLSEDH